jgi:hypothetical protein
MLIGYTIEIDAAGNRVPHFSFECEVSEDLQTLFDRTNEGWTPEEIAQLYTRRTAAEMYEADLAAAAAAEEINQEFALELADEACEESKASGKFYAACANCGWPIHIGEKCYHSAAAEGEICKSCHDKK